ncbi:MAG TPA: bifunctional phosphoribosylaminoimidazolecarboxamide formyltransferase/IMP cyclohydrolase [Thermoplasmata archaeon]|nr:bifunctional phosphoribosylaminoimidazolecarboxamide formyltransferase/IMP cyclohydrolase [Thermoplasmata archaeon]
MKPKRALISVYNKEGLENFCRVLINEKIEIYATPGTKKFLEEKGIEVKDTKEYTGFSEILKGRVKTLHTNIHAAILARENEFDEIERKGIKPIDMVVCNFYPHEVGIEEMDIGGPAMTRAAVKSWRRVVVVSHPSQYKFVIENLKKGFSEEVRKKLAIEALQRTSYYDAMLLKREKIQFPDLLCLPYIKKQHLRYGENPHQRGAFYIEEGVEKACVANAIKIQGKELSYNNILDINHAIECIKEFDEPTAVIIKHATPSGIACGKTIEEAWRDAFETDVYSPFGGIVALNRGVSEKLAEEMSKIFLEVIVAPCFDEEALKILGKKKNLRLLEIRGIDKEKRKDSTEIRSVEGGLLMQDKDVKEINPEEWKVVTIKKPSEEDIESMVFAMKCVRHVKSNSVVFVKGKKTVAIGGGQTSRVDATWIAVHKGKERIKGSIMASDAFFPFRDAVDVACEAGVKAIVQPGGSIRDEEVIKAADEHGIIMVFTGQRSFLH